MTFLMKNIMSTEVYFSLQTKRQSCMLVTFVLNPQERATRAALLWTICNFLILTDKVLDQAAKQ